MTTSLYARAVFFVSDSDRARTYYTEQLGFSVDWDSGDGVFQVSLMDFELILNEVGRHTHNRVGHGRVFIGLEDDQGDTVRRHIAEHPIQTYRVQWGRPTLLITDPDGNQLFFWMPNDEFSNLGLPTVVAQNITESPVPE